MKGAVKILGALLELVGPSGVGKSTLRSLALGGHWGNWVPPGRQPSTSEFVFRLRPLRSALDEGCAARIARFKFISATNTPQLFHQDCDARFDPCIDE